ncbi:hypothetical protein NN3_41600 [Nocardia neocaledoniensis NBRC 108232]|uniref:Uncharacterized protein n=1 Tax=Nocardia neocaledoniensis TaxID=236511 RepID=A0A317NHC9_9NOCA|nr:GAF domain-containing protein [Nocardia neocaledoniensis]PWV74512.1 hypothetical protein DFR69_106323 [Nocardia neocaledoniensis]GEM33153.1 hypothetical protein NN3_41600 [Nocardia neocaledoniensis NBRC 108232]
MVPWITVETLTPEAIAVASVGAESRAFASCERVLQRLLGKNRALYDVLTTRDLVHLIASARDHAEDADLRFATGAGEQRLLVRTVPGPSGDVHAVRLWLGPALARVPALPAAAGLVWDLPSQVIHQPTGIRHLTGSGAEEYAPRLSVAELFQRVSKFDRHVEVLDLLYAPRTGQKLQFEATVASRTGRRGVWRITVRARSDAQTRGAWLLVEDLTADAEPLTWSALDHFGLREAHRRAGTHLAIMQLDQGTISHWLTEPAPWVRWSGLFEPTDVFHPDDRVRLQALAGRLGPGDATEITVHTLARDGGYAPTELLLYPYPGYSAVELTIAQLVAAENVIERLRSAPDASRQVRKERGNWAARVPAS